MWENAAFRSYPASSLLDSARRLPADGCNRSLAQFPKKNFFRASYTDSSAWWHLEYEIFVSNNHETIMGRNVKSKWAISWLLLPSFACSDDWVVCEFYQLRDTVGIRLFWTCMLTNTRTVLREARYRRLISRAGPDLLSIREIAQLTPANR